MIERERPTQPAMPSHQLLDDRSLLLHTVVAGKLRADPALLARAQATLHRWLATASPRTAVYLNEWNHWLSLGVEDCLSHALDQSDHATAMRQSSPLACLLSNAERFAFMKAWRAQHPHPHHTTPDCHETR